MPTSGAFAPIQLVLTGCREFFRQPDWKPVPATLKRIQEYLEPYKRNGRAMFAGRLHIAGEIGIKIRTLARYLRYLTETGWLKVVQRTAHKVTRMILGGLQIAGLRGGTRTASAPYYLGNSIRREPPTPNTTPPEQNPAIAPKFRPKKSYCPHNDGLHPDLMAFLEAV